MDAQALQACPLFAGIQPGEIDAVLACLGARHRHYGRDRFILRAGDKARYVGIVASGGANVIQEDYWGNRSILAHIGPGGLFGEAFACAGKALLPVSVQATMPTDILLVEAEKIAGSCAEACGFHARLAANLLRILANKNIGLTQKIEHLSGRTIREKLLGYLSSQALAAGGNDIRIPFNRQELADYLGVERSALSRELSAMRRDGLLEYEKNRFRLL